MVRKPTKISNRTGHAARTRGNRPIKIQGVWMRMRSKGRDQWRLARCQNFGSDRTSSKLQHLDLLPTRFPLQMLVFNTWPHHFIEKTAKGIIDDVFQCPYPYLMTTIGLSPRTQAQWQEACSSYRSAISRVCSWWGTADSAYLRKSISDIYWYFWFRLTFLVKTC